MKKTFTLTGILALLLFINPSIGVAQCTGGTFTAGAIYDFASSAQGFTGDFTFGNGKLNSTTVNAGSTKVLISPTLFQPISPAIISWGFDLSGSANVTGYVVEAVYYTNGALQTVTLCSAPAISIIPGTRNFTAGAPSQILGAKFELKITFTVSGGGGVNITIDNFKTSASIVNAPLPVKFSSLDANTANNKLVLTWKVATDENVRRYNIERSSDGSHFISIGFVNATGDNEYSFTDNNSSFAGSYRIQSVDVDGKYNYSAIVSVKSHQSAIVFKAFPVPAFKNLTIQHSTSMAGSFITVNSEDGRVIKRIATLPGTQQTQIDFSSIPAGLYIITYTNNNNTNTLKLIKQ